MKILSPLSVLALLLATAALSAQPRTEEPRPLSRALSDARLHTAEGNYSAAVIELQGAIDSTAPGEHMADALYLLALSNFELQRYSAALSNARALMVGYPDDQRQLEIEYLYAIAAYQVGEMDDAEIEFHRISALEVTDSTNYRLPSDYWLARINAEQGRLDSAEIYAQRSVSTPNMKYSWDKTELGPAPLYLLAWLREGRGAIDSAAVLYRKVIDDYPGNDLTLDAQFRLGVIDARRGNYESASRLLNSITPHSDRQREEQIFYLGEVNAALGRYDEALRFHNEFLREYSSSPRSRIVRYGAGWAQLQLGRSDEALATFRQLEEGIDSISAASSYQIGAIQINRGDTAGAMRQFHSLLYRLPYESFSDNANYQLGRIHYRRADYDSARHYLLVTARQFPGSEIRPDAYYLLGESYTGLNDFSNAQFAFARAQKVGATGALLRGALYREGLSLYKVGRFRSAVDRFREYVSEHPGGEHIADATFWLGEALYQDRTYDEAERYYNAYLERFPSEGWREQALYGLAWSRFQQQEFEKAALAFKSFVADNPNSPLATEATIRLADSYRFLRQYDKAIETYESIGGVAGKGVRDEEARFRLADVYLQMGETERAVETYRKLIRDYPNSSLRDAYAYNIGWIYHDKEMDSLSIAELHRFIGEYPESQLLPRANFTIGDAYYNMEEYDSSLVYYRRVLDEHPNSALVPETFDAVRNTLDAMGRGREAVAIIDEFQRKNPDRIASDSLAFRKANIILEAGEYVEAMKLYRDLIGEHPMSALLPEATFRIGRAYEYLNNTDSALIIYREVIARYPASDAAREGLIEGAGIMLRTGKFSAAEQDYSVFISRYPESDRLEEARYGIAKSRLEVGDTTGALAGFQTVLDSASSSDNDLFLDRSRIETARLIALRGQTDRALELLAAVVSRRLDDLAAEAQLMRGEIYVNAKDLSGALAELRRLETDFNSYPEYVEPGMLLLGRVYEQLTNYTSARETYDRLIAQTENPDMQQEAEQRLRNLKR